MATFLDPSLAEVNPEFRLLRIGSPLIGNRIKATAQLIWSVASLQSGEDLDVRRQLGSRNRHCLHVVYSVTYMMSTTWLTTLPLLDHSHISHLLVDHSTTSRSLTYFTSLGWPLYHF